MGPYHPQAPLAFAKLSQGCTRVHGFGGSTPCGAVSSGGGHCFYSRLLGVVEIYGRILIRGWNTMFPRCGGTVTLPPRGTSRRAPGALLLGESGLGEILDQSMVWPNNWAWKSENVGYNLGFPRLAGRCRPGGDHCFCSRFVGLVCVCKYFLSGDGAVTSPRAHGLTNPTPSQQRWEVTGTGH